MDFNLCSSVPWSLVYSTARFSITISIVHFKTIDMQNSARSICSCPECCSTKVFLFAIRSPQNAHKNWCYDPQAYAPPCRLLTFQNFNAFNVLPFTHAYSILGVKLISSLFFITCLLFLWYIRFCVYHFMTNIQHHVLKFTTYFTAHSFYNFRLPRFQ